MKRIIIGIALAVTVAACNRKDDSQETAMRMQALRDSIRLDSFEKAEVAKKEAAIAAAATAAATRRAESSRRVSSSRSSYTSGTNYGYTQQPVAQQKKGWSSAAKGAVIGGVAGAITGVAIDKKDGRGAVVGGVVGAGTGYAIGRARDRKTGRVQ